MGKKAQQAAPAPIVMTQSQFTASMGSTLQQQGGHTGTFVDPGAARRVSAKPEAGVPAIESATTKAQRKRQLTAQAEEREGKGEGGSASGVDVSGYAGPSEENRDKSFNDFMGDAFGSLLGDDEDEDETSTGEWL